MPLKNQKSFGSPFWSGIISRAVRACRTRDFYFLLSVLIYIVGFIILYKWKNFGMGAVAIIPVITAAWVYGAAAGCAAGLLSLAANIVICQILGIDWYVRIIKSGAGIAGTIIFIIIGIVIGRISDLSRRLKKELAHKEQIEHELEVNRQSLEKLVEEKTVELSAALQQLTASNKELAANEKRLRAVFETAVDAIITTSSTGEIIGWNKAAESMYGYSAAEVLGRHVNMLIPERLYDSNNKGMMAALQQGRIILSIAALRESASGRTAPSSRPRCPSPYGNPAMRFSLRVLFATLRSARALKHLCGRAKRGSAPSLTAQWTPS